MSDISSEKNTPKAASSSREERFVHAVLKGITESKGFAARLRRADNPGTEYQSWDFLAAHNVNLESEDQRLPFVTIAAALAKTKAVQNGQISLGRALADCYDKGSESDPAKSRLRRLLACTDTPEVCRILRPILTLIASNTTRPLNFVRLLRQLRHFAADPQAIRAQWAQEFYGKGDTANDQHQGAE